VAAKLEGLHVVGAEKKRPENAHAPRSDERSHELRVPRGRVLDELLAAALHRAHRAGVEGARDAKPEAAVRGAVARCRVSSGDGTVDAVASVSPVSDSAALCAVPRVSVAAGMCVQLAVRIAINGVDWSDGAATLDACGAPVTTAVAAGAPELLKAVAKSTRSAARTGMASGTPWTEKSSV
jgi:hypothetical protein